MKVDDEVMGKLDLLAEVVEIWVSYSYSFDF
jgi:hypothetical protein